MRLFISHASEDKADFVRPLAEALRKEYEVWYDEYELTVGDSLLQKINRGLASCDFGVVVFSPSFFAKKWPTAELDGLFALESATRKIILPVWKGISEQEMKQFSPILAGRLAAMASDGIPKVVAEIKRAIDVSNRTRQITASGSVVEIAKAVDQSLMQRNHHERLSHSDMGVALVRGEIHKLVEHVRSLVTEIKQVSTTLTLNVSQPKDQIFGILRVRGNDHVAMNLDLIGLGGNYTYETELHALIIEERGIFAEDERPNVLCKLVFKPVFLLPQRLVWEGGGGASFSTENLGHHVLERLLEVIRKRLSRG